MMADRNRKNDGKTWKMTGTWMKHGQGLVNVLIEHHPTIGDIISNRYLKVMFKIPKKGHLPMDGKMMVNLKN